jgi:hypothetical protein
MLTLNFSLLQCTQCQQQNSVTRSGITRSLHERKIVYGLHSAISDLLIHYVSSKVYRSISVEWTLFISTVNSCFCLNINPMKGAEDELEYTAVELI